MSAAAKCLLQNKLMKHSQSACQCCYMEGQREICSSCHSYVSCYQYGAVDNLDSVDTVQLEVIIVVAVLFFLSMSLNVFFIFSHWRRNKRLQKNSNSSMTGCDNPTYSEQLGDNSAGPDINSTPTSRSLQPNTITVENSRDSELSDTACIGLDTMPPSAEMPTFVVNSTQAGLVSSRTDASVPAENAGTEIGDHDVITTPDNSNHDSESVISFGSSGNSSADGIPTITDAFRDAEDTDQCPSMSSLSSNSTDKSGSKCIVLKSVPLPDTNVDDNVSLEQDDKTVQQSETSYSDTSSFVSAASSRRDHNNLSDAHHNNLSKSRAIAVTLSVSSKDDESENNVEDNTSVQCESMSSVSLSYTDQSTHEDVQSVQRSSTTTYTTCTSPQDEIKLSNYTEHDHETSVNVTQRSSSILLNALPTEYLISSAADDCSSTSPDVPQYDMHTTDNQSTALPDTDEHIASPVTEPEDRTQIDRITQK